MPRRPRPVGAALLLGVLLAFASAFHAMQKPGPSAVPVLVTEPRSPEVGDEAPPQRRDVRWRRTGDGLDTAEPADPTEDHV